ncbi:hypothetical protein DCC85_13280 [Paenibacillus sp. CAA11]|uniref:SpoIIIAH-like family protein n=1 Tax=Paenibacillus sp. CAA11 TaxID=1532905 RepID=UPI000D3A51A2|nr:SpoIIIAH-like family protein [Paenibacillus sp. CAA11]AWB45099.1 hypothetical protein DCC85_13280 [Paenibacillus sp. CAA11]
MKSKRQTIWLVSMLSLMVILSAYYLFTEDSSTKLPKTADGQQVTAGDKDGGGAVSIADSAAGNSDVVATEVESGGTTADHQDAVKDSEDNAGTEAKTDGAVKGDSKEQTDKSGADKSGTDNNAKDKKDAKDTGAKSDEDVLKQVASQGTAGSDLVTNYQYERMENNAKKEEQLLQTINDLTKSADENAAAQQELNALQDREAKITDIEEQLQQQLKTSAAVTEQDDQYKVVVLSDKLDAKQAVNIVDLVIKQLGVTQDKVSVQYVTQ